jgi:hypothetical protein
MNCAVYTVEGGYKLQTQAGSVYCTSLWEAMDLAYSLGEDWAAAGPGILEPGDAVGIHG